MFCQHCGNQISDTARFCTFCGQTVYTSPAQSAGEKSVINNIPVPAENSSPDCAMPETPAGAQPEYRAPETSAAAQPSYNPYPAQPDVTQTADRTAPADSGKKKEKKKAERKLSAVAALAGIFLCLISMPLILFASLSGALHITFSPASVSRIIDGYSAKDLTFSVFNAGEATSVYSAIEDATGTDVEQVFGIKEKQVNELIESDFVRDFIKRVIIRYGDWLLRGKQLNVLKADEVIDLIFDNSDEINSITGYSFTEESSYTDWYSFNESDVRSAFDDIGFFEPGGTVLENSIGISLSPLCSILSSGLMWSVAVGALIFAALIMLICRKKLSAGCTLVGITTLLPGLAVAALGVGEKALLRWLGWGIINLFGIPLAKATETIGLCLIAFALIMMIPAKLAVKKLQED